MKAGIYCIENLINKKCYVGASKNISSRLYDHKRALKSNRHCNSHLQNSWNLYGENNFKFYAIEYCEFDEKLLNQKEEWWVRNLGLRNPEVGYNESDTFYGDYPIIKTAEHKAKIGEASKKNATRQWEENRKSGKSQIVVIDLITEEKEYYPAKIDCPVKFKNKNFNFAEKKFVTTTHNKVEKQIQEEFEQVKIRYEKYLELQTPHPDGNYKERRKSKVIKSEFYPVEFKSNFETLNFKTSQEAADYFGISVAQVSIAKTNGKYTKTMFYLINDNGIIDEAKNLKDLAKQNNHNYNAYKKVMSNQRNSYLGYIIHRNDVIFQVQKLSI